MPPPSANVERDRIDRIVRSTVGLQVADADELAGWVEERVRQLALLDVEQYRALLAAPGIDGRRERELITVRFTTGESCFWRDPGQCDLLAQTILPELIERRVRRQQRVLRLWSAGCAAGDEAYTLAILVDELGLDLAGWDVLILGTDIDASAIDKARSGLFGDWSFRTLDAARKQRYFQRCNDEWSIDARLRQKVLFRTGDLVHYEFPDAASTLIDFDLILCRNVFIYLDPVAIDRIVAKFARALTDGGYLVTAHGEMLGHGTAGTSGTPPLQLRMYAQSALFQKAAPIAGVAQPAAPSIAPANAQPSVDDLMQSAWRHADGGMVAAAQRDCAAAIALDVLDPRAHYLLAQLAQQRGDVAQATRLLNKVLYLDPGCIAAYLELGALHAQAGDGARARRMHRTARAALKKLPPQATVAPYRESNASDILAHVERLLAAAAAVRRSDQGG
jgi:chemotaxis protein methyltransferase CheR